jgi:hypothetical protein
MSATYVAATTDRNTGVIAAPYAPATSPGPLKDPFGAVGGRGLPGPGVQGARLHLLPCHCLPLVLGMYWQR